MISTTTSIILGRTGGREGFTAEASISRPGATRPLGSVIVTNRNALQAPQSLSIASNDPQALFALAAALVDAGRTLARRQHADARRAAATDGKG